MSIIVPIVEGPGDKDAAPLLLRRILHERMGKYAVDVKWPKMAKGKGGLVKDLEKFIIHASREPGCAAIIVLLDADKDCPKKLGNELASKARDTAVNTPIAVVCANPEYENWFLVSYESFSNDVEAFSDAKNWLTSNMDEGLVYKETKDQASLSQEIHIDAAFEASRSFRRLCSALDQLVACIETNDVQVTPGG